jgi:hypothetical protein
MNNNYHHFYYNLAGFFHVKEKVSEVCIFLCTLERQVTC